MTKPQDRPFSLLPGIGDLVTFINFMSPGLARAIQLCHNIAMKKLLNWAWKIYFAIYIFLTASNIYAFCSEESPVFWYYQILLAYADLFTIPFILAALSLIFNSLAILPLFLFIERKTLLTARIWKYFFIFRVILDALGKSYENQVLRSLFQDSVLIGGMAVCIMILLVLPSYLANYLYAFKRNCWMGNVGSERKMP